MTYSQFLRIETRCGGDPALPISRMPRTFTSLQPLEGTNMTKKDFVLIAGVVKELSYGTQQQAIAEAFANRLALTNKQFNREKFLRACGANPHAAYHPTGD